jgi:hypothetical protein
VQRWEYKVVIVTASGGDYRLQARDELTDPNSPDPTTMSLSQMLFLLGDQGYELVSALPAPESGDLIYTLRRLKS